MIVAKSGRFGPYVSEVLPEPEPEAETEGKKRTRKAAKPKPRTASLFKDMSLSSVTLDDALKLLSLPRVVGTDAEGVEITAQNGRYGPYLTKGKDSRSLETEAELFTVTLEQALELFSQPKRRRGAAAPKGPLRELGTDPNSGLPVVIKDGRFGPYFTDGKTNVTLRRDDDPATVTPELAYERLAEKRAKGPAKKTAAKKTTTKKAATKTTAKKATTKKTTAKAATSKTSTSKVSAAKTSAAKAAEASEA
jgi:DNA topoisomerase